MFNKGDLLICVANNANNPNWKGTLPTIGNYYTWREDKNKYNGYVEEIISAICPFDGKEYSHDKRWYIKIEDGVNIEKLLEECEIVEV